MLERKDFGRARGDVTWWRGQSGRILESGTQDSSARKCVSLAMLVSV
jgi:hypothetical protein